VFWITPRAGGMRVNKAGRLVSGWMERAVRVERRPWGGSFLPTTQGKSQDSNQGCHLPIVKSTPCLKLLFVFHPFFFPVHSY